MHVNFLSPAKYKMLHDDLVRAGEIGLGDPLPGKVDLAVAYVEDAVTGAAVFRWRTMESSYWYNQPVEVVPAYDVPMEVAAKLIVQGTSMQEFSDEYDAASAVAPYIKEDVEVD